MAISANTQVDKIRDDAIETANSSMYCLNCKFSYIQPQFGSGYCKFSKAKKVHMPPKTIREFDTCKHWKKKDEEL